MSAGTIELTEADKADLGWFFQGMALEHTVAAIVRRRVDEDRIERDGAICWNTTCLNCANLLDKLYAADAKVEQIRELVT